MPGIEELLTAKLSENGYRLWRKSWAVVISRVLAREVLASLDPESGRVTSPLPPINDSAWRSYTVTHASDIAFLCEAELMESFDILNAGVHAGLDNSGRPYDKRTKPRMRRHLRLVQAALMSNPLSSEILASISAIDIWRAAANELGRTICDLDVNESTLHNHLLLAGYFWACNLPNENLVAIELNDFATSMLSIQGTLVDIPERVSSRGIGDRRPTVVTHSGGFVLQHQYLSPLLDLLVIEIHKTISGQGFLMRWLGALPTETSARVDPSLMRSLRATAYPQYEYSVLAFMALSAIEQLLRAFACNAGLFQGQKRFTSSRFAQIVTALGGEAEVEEAIATVYDEARGNLRNRILHGAQLHIARSQRQATLSISAPLTHSSVPDAFSPESVLWLCLGCLRTLDEHIAKAATLTQADLEWTKHLALNSQEVRFGRRIQYDFVGDEGKRWWERIDDFLTAVTPNVKILFDVGFMGWIDHKRPDRIVLFMALNMVLEALFRTSVRIHGGCVLKRFDSTIADGSAAFRYRMLDQHELCAPESLDRLVESVDPSSRDLAKKVLTLAVKVRDAVAHGAIGISERDDGVAMGHLLVKAIQCLIAAGEHEMIKTAAYYQWERQPQRSAMDNWLDGEKNILNDIQDTIRLRLKK